MVEVNSAFQHSSNGKKILNGLPVISKVKVFATQGGWPADEHY